MKVSKTETAKNRRSFLRGGVATGAAALGAGLLSNSLPGFAKVPDNDNSGQLTRGDAAILKFLGAVEIIESDLWEQYWELGGIQDSEFAPATGGNAFYTDALTILDADMPQYIHDNTDDEFTHAAFLKAYLDSKGAATPELDFLGGPTLRTLQGSKADGSSGKGRLTNLTQLTVDTGFWTRYRTADHNPDLDPSFKFGQAVKGLDVGQHTAIPRSNDDTKGSVIGNATNHLKAIAFTAGFHFDFIYLNIYFFNTILI
jgi:hypothetical protein